MRAESLRYLGGEKIGQARLVFPNNNKSFPFANFLLPLLYVSSNSALLTPFVLLVFPV
jgi:hypothetical protein